MTIVFVLKGERASETVTVVFVLKFERVQVYGVCVE